MAKFLEKRSYGANILEKISNKPIRIEFIAASIYLLTLLDNDM